MPEPQSPELKTSNNPTIQARVDTEKGKLQSKFPNATPDIINQYGRDRAAADIRGKRQREQKEKVAMYDQLTDMLNRRWFDAELKKRIAELDRTKQKNPNEQLKPLWLLYFDLDKFKDVNTQYGEPRGGDHVLRAEAQLPSRIEEPIARVGGEEFAEIIDEEITEEQLAKVIGRYMKAQREISIKALADRELIIDIPDEERLKEITISFGLTQYIPGDTPKSFLERANLAMHEAKNTGRNKAVIATPSGGGKPLFRDLTPIFPE